MSALARGADAGYVLAFDRSPLAPCQQLRSLADRARWVDPENIVPLVDTRPRAVVRQGRSGITVEWGGGLLFRPTAAAK